MLKSLVFCQNNCLNVRIWGGVIECSRQKSGFGLIFVELVRGVVPSGPVLSVFSLKLGRDCVPFTWVMLGHI